MKKILVTGGLGFIGFHLIQYLFEKYDDPDITVIDNLSSSKIDFGPLYGKVKVIIKDLLDVDDIDDDFTDIYHLASPVGSLGILSRNGYVAKNIIDLIYKTVEITTKSNARLLNVSSSEIYGHSGIHFEDDAKYILNTSGTRTEYALGKIVSETILANLDFNNHFNYNTVRPFNVIGEQQCSMIGFVWPSFFENAIHHKDIPVFYNGLQKRSFCHAKDIVRAMVCIQESDIRSEVFNIGHDGNIITIIDLARRIKQKCNSRSEIDHIDPVKKYGKCYLEAFDKIPNIEKITRLLGWKPEISLEESLERVFHYYKNKTSNN
jgi:nucleoside-diphosphate-sugar epimerase